MALTQVKLAAMSANSVDSDQYVDGSIDNIHLATDAVTSTRIQDASVTTAKIADNQVNGDKLANNITLGGTLTVGVNDAGHDVKFFGDTASKYCLWDTSADELDIDGNINISDSATFGGQVNFTESGGNSIMLAEGTGFKQTVSGTTHNVLALDYGKFEAYCQGGKKLETTTSGVTVTGTVTDSKGDVRSILQTSKSASYTPSDRSDVGKHIYTDSAVVINNSVTWVAGDAISIVNKHASNNVVITFTNITAYIAGDATAKGTITVAARGMGTILFTTATECFVSGAGLS